MYKCSKLIVLLLISAASCTYKNDNSNKLASTIQDLLGNVVHLATPSLVYNEDNYNQFSYTDYKIVVYTDSADCVDCMFKLDSWKEVISDFETNFQNTVSFYFFFHPAAREHIENLLIKENFKYPIFIDTDNKFYNSNKIPASGLLRCFLLDKNNRIVSVGNPTLASGAWRLYREIVKDSIMFETLSQIQK
ncbi:hypothetical protein [Sphingobacterium corticibacter]|uniref:Redoxin domain-containing protein n=1 Tax=Sphingobacterium corticibacter TaxID=2171749 RepID=A0A2T8HK27_9SPHI|nr:hypothetical protein [Sphingobacterium corticibacter]PVH25662.1 hypothetical protein DC487_06885 [Sphingobacterium corticibacter]